MDDGGRRRARTRRRRRRTRALGCTLLVLVAIVSLGLVRWSRHPGPAAQQEPGSDGLAGPDSALPFARVVIDPADLQADCKAVGDLNGDGRPDVVVAGNTGTPLQWYESPTWTRHVIDPRSVFSTDMQTADVDGDGDLDVVVPDAAAKALLWYRNPRIGGGDWGRVPIGPGDAHDLAVGDVNRDGHLDVVARGHDGPTVLYLQRTPTEWARLPITAAADGEGLTLADLDRDGDQDIVENGVWFEAPTDLVRGAWTPHRIAGGWPSRVSVAVRDLDADGRADVILAPSEAAGRMVWYQAPADARSEGWREHVVDGAVERVHRFEPADVDGDGDLDIAFAETHESKEKRVGVFLNRGRGEDWDLLLVSTTGSHNIRVADVDRDGAADIIGANWSGSSPLELWRNLRLDPLATWRRHVVDSARPDRAVFVLSADVDGDDLPDVLSGGWWYRNPGSAGGNWARRAIGAPLHNVAAVFDYDGDGRLDVLGTTGKGSDPSAEIVWARNEGRGRFRVFRNVDPAQGDFLQGVAVGRFQPGGPIETALSWHDAAGGGTQMLTTPADPTRQRWTWRSLSPVTQSNGVAAGDVDRDGDLDLVLGTRWLRNDGGAWTPFTLSATAGEPDRVELADINRDGRLDAVVGFETISRPGKLVWYEQPQDPTRPWPEHLVSVVVGPMSVGVADMDGDGDSDVVVGEHNLDAPQSAKLYVMRNTDGRGGRWVPQVVSVGDEHHDGARPVDVDGDGDLDILSIGWSHANVLLYENRAPRSGNQR